MIGFKVGDFYDIPFEDNTFDAVFFGNCFAYVTDSSKTLNEQKRVTKNREKLLPMILMVQLSFSILLNLIYLGGFSQQQQKVLKKINPILHSIIIREKNARSFNRSRHLLLAAVLPFASAGIKEETFI